MLDRPPVVVAWKHRARDRVVRLEMEYLLGKRP